MYQVWLKHQKGGFVAFGPPVPDLASARIVVKTLDWLRDIKSLPFTADFYDENTEIEASNLETGERHEYADQDPSGASDGVWF